VAQHGGGSPARPSCCSGPRSLVARLYSIAVAPRWVDAGGSDAARGRRSGCGRARLPRHPPRVHMTNHAAISRYRKAATGNSLVIAATTRTAASLRFESGSPNLRALRSRRLFHQTTDSPAAACIMMALPGRSKIQAGAAFEFQLWRKPPPSHELGTGRLRAYGWRLRSSAAASSPSLCQPPRPYFLDTANRRQAPRHAVTQLAFQREAKALDIPAT